MSPDRQQILDVFENAGLTDLGYLGQHLPRFLDTYLRFDSTWDHHRGVQVLDVGAHWLHQSMVFRLGGYEVTAIDLPITFGVQEVQQLAQRHDIDLLPVADLSRPQEMGTLAADSVDVVLFTEILEHMSFNPVPFWREIYRVLKPRGRIVLSTPNYYAAGSRSWNPGRFLAGFGGGIPVDDVLSTNTYGHHWKEYSRQEVIKYFCLLSPDFDCVKAEYTDYGQKASSLGWLQRRFAGLKAGLYLEVELKEKRHGIVVTPDW